FGPTTGSSPLQYVSSLITAQQRHATGMEVKVEVKRKESEKVETLTAKLVPTPEDLPDKLPLPSSAGKALEGQPKPKDPKDPFPPKLPPENVRAGFSADDKKEDKKDDKPKVETGVMTRTNQALGREYWIYVPDNYDP